MKRNWMAMLVLAGGLESAMFGQQYPQQYPQQNPPYQGDPNYNGQYGNGQYDNGQYAGDQGSGDYNGDPAYNGSSQGVYAPAPPPMPNYAYQRPPMPGPGYYWVDGYWGFLGGRYSWVGGYWMLPPYSGGYWVAPRYSSGRFFSGFWGGGRQHFDRGFVRNDYRYQGRVENHRPSYGYRAPERGRYEFRGGDNHGGRSGNWGERGGRR
jgi:hypothetical protein